MKADRVQRWINRIADNKIEGFGQEREMPIRLISDSHTDYKFSGSYLIRVWMTKKWLRHESGQINGVQT